MNGLRTLLSRLDNSPNRIALWTAIRGSIAIGVPLFVLPELGLGSASRFVVVGALPTGIVDTGGPYGQRLRGMLANAVISPLACLLGALCGNTWWLAALAMAMVAAAGGMMRALGPAAAPLGVTHAVAFLIGTQIPELRLPAPEMVAAYAAGGLWTILVSLAIWRARPCRRLEHEVASVWEDLASLLESIRAAGAMEGAPARLERSLAVRQRTMRETIERARVLLDEARGELSEQSASIEALLVLLRAASRIATVASALADVVLRDASRKHPAELIGAIEAVERASRAVGVVMTNGRGEIPVAACRDAVRRLYEGALMTDGTARTTRRRLAPLGLALRDVENAQDAAEALFGTRQRFRGLLPPLGRARPWQASLAALEAHFAFRSLILRHALRVALCTGVATAVMLWLQIPHGIWLPLTALVVSQPEFAARSGARSSASSARSAARSWRPLCLDCSKAPKCSTWRSSPSASAPSSCCAGAMASPWCSSHRWLFSC